MLSLLLTATLTASEHQVLVRAGRGAAVTCVVHDETGAALAERLAGLGPGRWRWRAARTEVLSCSSPGFEPISWLAGQPGMPARVERELWPARRVTLRARGSAIDTVIEWRRLDAGATGLVARLHAQVGDGLSLPVAPVARVIRLRPEGLSPVSLYVPEGAGDLTLDLPSPRVGGAIFGTLPAHTFAPIAIELAAAHHQQTIPVAKGRVFQASGLSAGAYLLTPRYRGGVLGATQRVAVRAGETTEVVPLSLAEPGAVSLSCGAGELPQRLVLRRPQSGEGPPPWEQEISPTACGGELEGLVPGLYEALVGAAGNDEAVTARARFEVVAGKMAEARLEGAEVHVTGRLTLGGDPAPGSTLVFENAGRSWTARTDDQGVYAAWLGRPGDYRISVPSGRDRLAGSFRRLLQAGEQTADFALNAAAVRVRARRDDDGPLIEEVQLAVTSRAGRRISAPWRPSQEAERHLAGLDLGEYWITARSSSGLVSLGRVRVELTADAPVAEVELVLGRHAGVLEVTDEAGIALPDSQVEGRESLLTAVAPGAFALGTVPMGEWLAIRAAGFLAACRVLEPDDLPATRVALSRATGTLALRLDEPLAWEDGTLQAEGSDCPITLSDIERDSVREGTGTIVRLRLAPGRYRLAFGEVTATAEVPGRDLHLSDFTPRP